MSLVPRSTYIPEPLRNAVHTMGAFTFPQLDFFLIEIYHASKKPPWPHPDRTIIDVLHEESIEPENRDFP